MLNNNINNIVNKIYNNNKYIINNKIINNIIEHININNIEIINYNKNKINNNKYICIITDNKYESNMYINRLKNKFIELIGYNPLLIYRITKKSNAEIIINKMNNDNSVIGIILTQPLFNRDDKYYFNLINKNKNIDNLGYNNYSIAQDLPTTAFIINEVIIYIYLLLNKNKITISLIGDGLTVNNPLYKYLTKNNNYHLYSINRNIMNNNVELYRRMIEESDIIVSSTGVGGLLKENMFKGKVIISPTIQSVDGVLVSDVSTQLVPYVITNSPKGTIGKLTVLELIKRFVIKQLTK